MASISFTDYSTVIPASWLNDVNTLTYNVWNGVTTPGQARNALGLGSDITKTLSLAGNLTTSGAYGLTLTLTGTTNVTLPTTGTLATTSNKLSAFAATTSAELAGVISDETGTGALVFANTPTLVTPILGVASATSLATSAGTPLLMTNAQLVNVVLAAQTVGTSNLNIPDMGSTNDTFAFITKAQTLTNKTLASPAITGAVTSAFAFTPGAGATAAVVSGCVYMNTTSTNSTNAGFQSLVTETLDANTLNANGKAIRITTWGTSAANANAKNVGIFFGAAGDDALVSIPANYTDWRCQCIVVRTGASAQVNNGIAYSTVSPGTTPSVQIVNSTPAEDTTTAISISATCNTTVAADVVLKGFMIEVIN